MSAGHGRPAAIAVAAGVAALLVLRLARHFPWSLAAIAALAVGVLAAAALRTSAQLRRIWRDDDR